MECHAILGGKAPYNSAMEALQVAEDYAWEHHDTSLQITPDQVFEGPSVPLTVSFV
jgi:hypothetical protein